MHGSIEDDAWPFKGTGVEEHGVLNAFDLKRKKQKTKTKPTFLIVNLDLVVFLFCVIKYIYDKKKHPLKWIFTFYNYLFTSLNIPTLSRRVILSFAFLISCQYLKSVFTQLENLENSPQTSLQCLVSS